MYNKMAKKASKIVAAALAAAIGAGVSAYAENAAKPNESAAIPPIESEQTLKEPVIIATFEYNSNRPDENFGKRFIYNIWSDNTISQADKPRVKFSQLWFWDINRNGQLDKFELESGKLVYMHPKFNELADSEIRKALEGMVLSPQRQGLEEKYPENPSDRYDALSQKYNQRIAKAAENPELPPEVPGKNYFDEDTKRANKEYLAEATQKLQEQIASGKKADLMACLSAQDARIEVQKRYEDFASKALQYHKPQAIKNLPLPLAPGEAEGEKSGLIPLSAIVGINYSINGNAAGINAGLRLGYNEDALNFAILGSYQRGFSNEPFSQSITRQDPVSPAGMYGESTIDTILNKNNFNVLGVDAAVYFGPEIVKAVAGMGWHRAFYDWNRVDNHTSKVKTGDVILNQNNYSESFSGQGFEDVIRGYIGADWRMGPVRGEVDFGLEKSLISGTISPFAAARITIAPPSKYKNRK